MITLKIDFMDTSKRKKAIQEQFKNATDEELLINIRISKFLSFLFSKNFYRLWLVCFSMMLNFNFFSKTDNEVRFIMNTIISVLFSFFITEFLNTDENASIEKRTADTLRKMRQELN